MKCPNCNSIIPDDSQYCPDCGAVIEREEDLRREASCIASSYKKGYDYYVSNGTLPQFSSWLSVEAYKRIISYKAVIIAKNKEIINEEERLRKDAQIRVEEERQRNKENLQLAARTEADRVKDKCRKGWGRFIFYLLLLVADFGVEALLAYLQRDNDARGLDAFIDFLPCLIFILIGGYLAVPLISSLSDVNSIDKDKVEEWKKQNPNNPACKYL